LAFEKNANLFADNSRKSQKIVIITSTPGRFVLRNFAHFSATFFFHNSVANSDDAIFPPSPCLLSNLCFSVWLSPDAFGKKCPKCSTNQTILCQIYYHNFLGEKIAPKFANLWHFQKITQRRQWAKMLPIWSPWWMCSFETGALQRNESAQKTGSS
jgi:hypothetical protein